MADHIGGYVRAATMDGRHTSGAFRGIAVGSGMLARAPTHAIWE